MQTETTKQTKNNHTEEEDLSRFKKIVTERFMYKATKDGKLFCGKKPLIGVLADKLAMPPIKGKAWHAFLIVTTRPTLALNREKEMVEVPRGVEVLIPATFELDQFLTAAAEHPQAAYEVFIQPDEKIDIGAGQTMWKYDLRRNPKAVSREALGLLPPSLAAPKALPAPKSDDEGDDELPF